MFRNKLICVGIILCILATSKITNAEEFEKSNEYKVFQTDAIVTLSSGIVSLLVGSMLDATKNERQGEMNKIDEEAKQYDVFYIMKKYFNNEIDNKQMLKGYEDNLKFWEEKQKKYDLLKKDVENYGYYAKVCSTIGITLLIKGLSDLITLAMINEQTKQQQKVKLNVDIALSKSKVYLIYNF